MYDVDDAVAKIDGYIISIAGAAAHVGEKRMVRIDQVGRTAASALLLDESGEVVRPTPRAPAPTAKPRPRRRTPKPVAPAAAVIPAAAVTPAAANGSSEVASASQTPTGDIPEDEGSEDDLQSKPRRRGRRGGRRRSAAKAKVTPE
jgi:ribonuclease G